MEVAEDLVVVDFDQVEEAFDPVLDRVRSDQVDLVFVQVPILAPMEGQELGVQMCPAADLDLIIGPITVDIDDPIITDVITIVRIIIEAGGIAPIFGDAIIARGIIPQCT